MCVCVCVCVCHTTARPTAAILIHVSEKIKGQTVAGSGTYDGEREESLPLLLVLEAAVGGSSVSGLRTAGA